MANKIEILVEVDPNGRGSAAIKNVGVNIDQLGKKTRQAGQAGREALDGFGSGLGVPTSIAAASAATAAGILLIGNAAKNASLDAANAQRILRSDAQQAGLEFAAVQAEARKFGDDLALSNTQAENSFARFLRVVKAAGLTENLTQYRKQFADLAAAYGLNATEVETLTSQLLSGQDEALNRLGIADPSQLYKSYAASVGKTVEELTQEEQVRARLLAVTEKGRQFEGVAAQRLTEQVGQWAQLNKTIADTTTSLGDFLTKRTVVGELPGLFTSILKGENPLEGKQRQLEAESAARAAQARAKAEKDANDFLAAHGAGATADVRANPFASFANRELILGKDQAAKEREGFVSQYTAIFKDKRLSTTTAIFAEEQFQLIRGIFDPEKAAEIEDGFNKFWDKYAKVALGALKTARDAAEKNFSLLADRATGGNNPYVKILVDAEERAKDLAKTFGVLGEKVVSEMRKTEDAYTKQKLLALDLDQALKAAALRREASSLENFKGISGAEQRQLDVLDKQISAANSIPELLAKAEAIAKGLIDIQKGQLDKEGNPTNESGQLLRELALDFEQINRATYEGLRDLRGGGGRAEDRVNQALVDFFNELAPEFQAKIASGEGGLGQQRVFADAFRGVADSAKRAIEEEVAKAAVADRAVQAVQDDIAKIEEARRAGLGSREADARLLATTGELAPGEMSADIRQARIEALRREADAESTARETATKALETSTAATEKLTASIDALAEETRKPQNRRLLVDINNRARADARTELYGSLGEQ